MANISKAEREKRELEKKESLKTQEAVNSKVDEQSTIEKENENLKEQLANMMKLIQSLQEKETVSETKQSDIIDSSYTNEDIELNARISVTSLTTGGVNLRTATDGTAKHFRLEKLGQTIPIIYEHLISCINSDRWLFEDGLVYINDSRAVREQYLEDHYKNFLTADKIANILNFDINTITQMVSTTTPAIQETIALVVANKINKGDLIDMNKVDAIGKACSVPVDIRDIANKLR